MYQLSLLTSSSAADALATSGPIQLGLTGSIGMGKSTITSHLRRLGFDVFDADATVHTLYGANGAHEGIYMLNLQIRLN